MGTPISEDVARLICPEAFRMRDEFDRAMDRLVRSTGATREEVDQAREQLLELSQTTSMSVARAADHLVARNAAVTMASTDYNPRVQEQPVTDILADIDGTLADWHGSKDSMRWRPDGDADEPRVFTAPVAGVYEFEMGALRLPAISWRDRSGAEITMEQANELLGDRSYSRVALTRIRSRTDRSLNVHVSTVWLALETFGGSLFETMVFGGPLDGSQWRWPTEAAALDGHVEVVVKAGARVRRVRVENCQRIYGPPFLDARYRQRQRNRRKRR